MKVDVYFNLHKKVLSVRHKGKVIHYARLMLLKDVEFVVSKSGRERVLKDNRKNVHAFVRGEVVDSIPVNSYKSYPVKYDPYKSGSFLDDKDNPVYDTKWVHVGVHEYNNKPYIMMLGRDKNAAAHS
tara:strand:- start:11422 stop:11802 length:381 start_codon:yes stop_codon:yes gene_type:complete